MTTSITVGLDKPTKRCVTCDEEKSTAEGFYLSGPRRRAGGTLVRYVMSDCKVCWGRKSAAYRESLPIEQRQEYHRRYRTPEQRRERNLKTLYGMSIADYKAMEETQDGVCAICSRAPAIKPLSVDHDHSCCPSRQTCGACRRGLLCPNCNTMLGMAGEDASVLERAAAYLRSFR